MATKKSSTDMEKKTWSTVKKWSKATNSATTKSTQSKGDSNVQLVKKIGEQIDKKMWLFQTLVVVMLIVIVALWFINYNSNTTGLRQALEDMEAMKVWWQENFELLKKVMNSEQQKQQYKQQFEQMLGQIEWGDWNNANDWQNPTQQANNNNQELNNNQQWNNNQQANNNPNQRGSANTISQSQISDITDDYVKWNKDAPIYVIEYTDFECPFCQRHHNNGTLEQVIENYNWQVAVMLKHFPIPNLHPNAERMAEAAECVWDQLWTSSYFDYAWLVFENANSAKSKSQLANLATQVWANKSSFTQCLDSNKFANKVAEDRSEWRSIFGVSGTPWNVVINTETWERTLVAWAYPFSKFKTEVDKLLN